METYTQNTSINPEEDRPLSYEELQAIDMRDFKEELKGLLGKLSLEEKDLAGLIHNDFTYWERAKSAIFQDEKGVAEYQAYLDSIPERDVARRKVAEYGINQMKKEMEIRENDIELKPMEREEGNPDFIYKIVKRSDNTEN